MNKERHHGRKGFLRCLRLVRRWRAQAGSLRRSSRDRADHQDYVQANIEEGIALGILRCARELADVPREEE